MTLIRKSAAIVALVAAAMIGTGVVTASAAAADGTDGYTWADSTATGVHAGSGTDSYTWAD